MCIELLDWPRAPTLPTLANCIVKVYTAQNPMLHKAHGTLHNEDYAMHIVGQTAVHCMALLSMAQEEEDKGEWM